MRFRELLRAGEADHQAMLAEQQAQIEHAFAAFRERHAARRQAVIAESWDRAMKDLVPTPADKDEVDHDEKRESKPPSRAPRRRRRRQRSAGADGTDFGVAAVARAADDPHQWGRAMAAALAPDAPGSAES